MFLKNLKITSEGNVIRDMNFTNGLNLIVDRTPTDDKKKTGNNVGKTTVLKLIYFCLGGDGSDIYTDEESQKDVYEGIKEFLINNRVLITLTLVKDLNSEESKEIVIERNFLQGGQAIRRINGEQLSIKDFDEELKSLVFPGHIDEKPSFKQLISHNIRYKHESINNTLRTLPYATDIVYESLYLYLLGCTFENVDKKQAITNKLNQEHTYKERLEKKGTKNTHEFALKIIEGEIAELNNRKSSINENEGFEEDLDKLNLIKCEINKLSSAISMLTIRRDIILEAQKEMERNVSFIDIKELEMLYAEANNNLHDMTKSFKDLVNFHNKMTNEKIKFITQDLPEINHSIISEENKLKEKLKQERILTKKISKSDSFEDLERIIADLNEKYRQKGEKENSIHQINEVDDSIKALENELKTINSDLYSQAFEEKLKKQVDKFNKHFSAISSELYDEKYALKFDRETHKKTGQPVYKFSAFNVNMSSGKKQGEILCFDLAYILFADEEGIPTLHFLLNDKKELMHDNQLLKVAEFVRDSEIQLVISILKDKLPEGLLEQANVVVELSQESKLFKI